MTDDFAFRISNLFVGAINPHQIWLNRKNLEYSFTIKKNFTSKHLVKMIWEGYKRLSILNHCFPLKLNIWIFRLLQRRTSTRLKDLSDRRKLNNKEDASATSSATEEETEENIFRSRNDKLLEQRQKELEELQSNREKIKNERALRAQRRLEDKP